MWLFRARLCRPASVLPVLFFLVLLCGVCGAGTSVNIPVGSRLYRDFERLEMKGLLESSMLATRPFDRLEGARLVTEAVDRAALNGVDGFSGARPLIYRLEREFSEELFAPGGEYARLKPVSSAYFKTLWVDDAPFFAEINNNGDNLRGGLNQRIGFVLTGSLFDAASFYLNPEFRADGDGARGRLVHGYVKLDFLGLSLLAGRDSLWWGPGFHGNLLVTNNAKPFDQVMLTSRHPFLLPWLFSRIGLLKPVVFLTRLEADRDYPRANLLGMRLDIKPTPNLELSLNRVFMFGGEGRKSLDAGDWFDVFFASDSAEHSDSPVNGNQIASITASYRYLNDNPYLPFSAVKLYTEWGAEDSSGSTRTPTGRAYIYGLLIDEPFRLRGVDFRAEWADTGVNAQYGPAWYRHGVYTTGYTFEGRVIGHHMGGDSKDLFLRASYNASATEVGVEADREWSGVHSAAEVKRDWIAADIYHETSGGLGLSGGAGFERLDGPNETVNNPTAWVRAEWRF